MKIVIHAGMHKTGSSSIQRNFAKFRNPNLRYANWRSPNHSSMFALLFGPIEDTLNYQEFRKRGLSLAEVQSDRTKWMAVLDRDISSSQGKSFLLSAELFSSPKNRSRLEDTAQFFKERGEVRIIAYVRPPISFMQSAMQQRLKGGAKLATFNDLYPTYRQRFEILDNLFGRESVELIKYDRKFLYRGDVVLDFAKRLGIDIPESTIKHQNESLSLEAAGALYIQRTRGSGHPIGFPQAIAANRKLVDALREMGSTKIVFSAELVRPIIEAHKDDIDWIENRLGQPLLDPTSDSPTVGNVNDLINSAIRVIPEIERTIRASPKSDRTLEYALYLVEQLKNQCEADARSQPVR